jgi:transcriptional regulator
MFVRPSWQPWDPEEAWALIGEYPWALLVQNGEDGPFATNLPLFLDRARGTYGTLVGHLARANAHAAVLGASRAPALAVFEGPYRFVTASWYPNRDMPGTYYYTAVHCYGPIRLQTTAELEASLGVLNGQMEGRVPNGWKMTEVPHSEITRRLPSIVGFELTIERFEAKFKLGQDEPKKDALAVAGRLEATGDPTARSLASMVRRANEGRDEGT